MDCLCGRPIDATNSTAEVDWAYDGHLEIGITCDGCERRYFAIVAVSDFVPDEVEDIDDEDF